MLPLRDLTTKLSQRVYRRVHFPAELALRLLQRGDDVHERNAANDHQVHVAGGSLGPGGNRPKKESGLDTVLQARERILENLSGAERFTYDPAQLLIYHALRIDLEIDLAAIDGAGHNARFGQTFKLALHGPRSKAQAADDLTLVEPLTGVSEKQGQEGLSSGAEQGVCER